MKCPSCGAEIENGRFCTCCGTQLFSDMLGDPELLDKHRCPKCGNELRATDAFCPNCGNSIIKQTEKTVNKRKHKNPIVIPLLVSLVAQAIGLVGTCSGGSFGAAMFTVFLVSLVVTFILSVLCIILSKKVEKNKGQTLGVVFTVLTSLPIIFIALVAITTRNDIEIQAKKTASEAVEVLKDSLKSPPSLYLHSVYVEVQSSNTEVIVDGQKQNKDEPFEGYFTVYIDYSAENGFGGTTRSYFEADYYVVGKNRTLVKARHIESLPQLTGTIYKIDGDTLR